MKNQTSNSVTKDTVNNLSKVFICHRIPERTFKVGKWYFPVCSRCTGMYISMFSYYVFVYFVYVEYTPLIIITALIMGLPAFLDGSTQFFEFRESNNTLRFATGLLAGLGLGILFKAFKHVLIN